MNALNAICAMLMLLAMSVLSSCVPNPTETIEPPPLHDLPANGAYVLCEGLWRQDNTTLSRINLSTWSVEQDIFARINNGLRLGDTGNDMVRLSPQSDTMLIAMTGSRTIERVRISTGESLGRLRFSATRIEPRQIAVVNDTTAFCTTLNDDSIIEFNPKTLTMRGEPIRVGPAPEGIAVFGEFLFVANSGFGDFRAREPKAGTVSVVSLRTRREVRVLEHVPNVIGVRVSNCGNMPRLYVAYVHLPSQADSLGGIVEYDADSFVELRRWRTRGPSSLALNARCDTLFFLHRDGVGAIALHERQPRIETILPRPTVSGTLQQDVWYALAIRSNAERTELWICNARNYVQPGEMIVAEFLKNASTNTHAPQITKRLQVGLNPRRVVFY